MTRARRFALPAAILVAIAVPALAAEPQSGKVSKAAPIVKWKGNAPGYIVLEGNMLLDATGQSGMCETQSGTCDEFALEVVDSDDLTLEANAGTTITELQVVKPDGSTVFSVGDTEGHPAATMRIAKAKPGTYTVQVLTNDIPGAGGDYTGKAKLGKPFDPDVDDEPAATVATNPPPAPSATLSVRTRSASARTIARSHRLKLAIGASGPVTAVKIYLAKGRKVYAQGSLAKLNGNRTVKLKVARKLAKGAYTIVLRAKDARGSAIAASAPFKIKR